MKKSDKISTREEWVDMVLKDKGKLYYNMEHQTPIDSRTQTWFPIPLKDFVGVLLEERAKYKQLVKKCNNKRRKSTTRCSSKRYKIGCKHTIWYYSKPVFQDK